MEGRFIQKKSVYHWKSALLEAAHEKRTKTPTTVTVGDGPAKRYRT
jgi:hypothetical protein